LDAAVRFGLIVVIVAVAACEFQHPSRLGDGGGDSSVPRSLSTFAIVPGVTLRTRREAFGHLVTPGRLTVIEGSNDGSSSVEEALIDSHDVLGDFALGTSLPDNTGFGTVAVRAAGIVYVLGGTSASTVTVTEDQCAPIATDGTLSTFSTMCPPLAASRRFFGAAVTGNSVYVFGGQFLNSAVAEALDSVERAPLAGRLGGFQTVSDVHLVAPRFDFSTVVAGNRVYVLGGSNGNVIDSVEVATIAADGTLGTFADAGVHLVAARSGHAALLVDNTVYAIGGYDYTGPNETLHPHADVEAAPILADGTLGPFETVANVTLQTARYDASADVIGSSIYVVGGIGDAGDGSLAPVTTVERATLQ
jgi:hypothetical protein